MDKKEKVIWIVNHYASHLESRHLELAKVFADNGYKTAVITSSYHHGKREYLYDEPIEFVERSKGVTFVYLHSKPEYRTNGAKRILNMLDFCKECFKYQGQIAENIGEPNYVIGSSAHPFVWEVGFSMARKYKAKFIAEFRDIWPMSLVEIQNISKWHPFVILLGMIEKRAYKHADAIVSTMPYAYKHVCDELGFPRDKMYWMPNGINTVEADENLKNEQEIPTDLYEYLTKNWCGVYVGSIVKSEHIDYIVEAWKLVESDMHLAIVGEGGGREQISQLIDELELKNVKMFPAIDKTLIPKVLSLADCCVSAYCSDGLGRYGLSKYKLCDYLYSGKPTVFACDVENIVKQAGHFSIPAGNYKEYADAMLSVKNLTEDEKIKLAKQGRQLIQTEFDYTSVGRKYLDMLLAL